MVYESRLLPTLGEHNSDNVNRPEGQAAKFLSKNPDSVSNGHTTFFDLDYTLLSLFDLNHSFSTIMAEFSHTSFGHESDLTKLVDITRRYMV
jgi:hypothetical protein